MVNFNQVIMVETFEKRIDFNLVPFSLDMYISQPFAFVIV